MGGSDIKETMGKRLGLKVSGRYKEVAAIGRWPLLEARLYIPMDPYCTTKKLYIVPQEILYCTTRNDILYHKKLYIVPQEMI